MSYPKLKGFKIGHLNIASLPKHIDELKLFMKELSFDILCINETRLDNTINDNIIKIPGYDIVRRDRDRNGGGVAIYVRSIISYKNHIEIIPGNLESICIEIHKPKSKPVLIVTCYRPPNTNSSVLNDFETLLLKLEDTNIDFIITGDLNCDMIAKNPTHLTKRLYDLINEFQLKQHIISPTRITPASKTLIDLIMTKSSDTFRNKRS